MNNMTKVLMTVLVVGLLAGVFLLFRAQQNNNQSATMEQTPTQAVADVNSPSAAPQVTGAMKDDEASDEASVKTFNVTGENFSFTPKEMRVKEGDTVKVVFTSKNGIHDWMLDEFNARTKSVSTNESDTVQFVANKKGTFEYYCSVGAHRANGMVGSLIVE